MPRDVEKQRIAKRRYYENNRAVYRAKNQRKRERLRALTREAKSKPCADCGQEFPYYVMDFDHIGSGNKVIEVAMLVNALSVRRLLAEIEKCEVVCANCHRIRTFKRQQYTPGSSNGRTSDSGSENWGSNPCPGAKLI